tara:strand:+ start:23 stop:418 length:396 start_codon:yes stop_codon:yes gene_type:complete
MTQESPYKIVKLVNGEDIICMMEDDGNKSYKVIWPLKMQIVPKMTKKGIMEALNLSTWIQVYTEERVFDLPSSSVVMMMEPSPGLTKYYELVLRKLMHEDEEVDEWTEEINEEDIYDELLEEEETPSKLIH